MARLVVVGLLPGNGSLRVPVEPDAQARSVTGSALPTVALAGALDVEAAAAARLRALAPVRVVCQVGLAPTLESPATGASHGLLTTVQVLLLRQLDPLPETGFLEPDQFPPQDRELIRQATAAAGALLSDTSVATALLPERFALRDLRGIYEAVWGVNVDPSNFRKRVLASDFLVAVGSAAGPGTAGRPPTLYRRGPGSAPVLRPPLTAR